MKRGVTFHWDRLWAVLNRAWRPISYDEFEELPFDEMDLAVHAAEMTQADIDWIWEKKRFPFEVF